MKLILKHSNYWLKCQYAEREQPKAAGFKWNKPKKLWFTPDPLCAVHFIKYAVNEETASGIMAAKEKMERALAASGKLASSFPVPTPDGLELYPFQKAAVEFAMVQPAHRMNVLIADQMRMGKTLEVIGVINAAHDRIPGRILIICPATVKVNWRRELEKWLVDYRTIGIAYGSQPFPDENIVIINYDIVARFKEQIQAVKWGLLVCDECHYLKNPEAQRTKNIVGYKDHKKKKPDVAPINAWNKLMLTGTPIVNRPKDAFPVLNFLDPKTFPNFFRFGMRYCDAHQGEHGWDFNGASNLSEFNMKLRSTVMVRRLRRDVIKDFPAKDRQVIEMPADKLLREEIKALKKLNRSQGKLQVMAQLARIRHKTALAKVPQVVKHLANVIESGDKVVCFAWHQDVIQNIAAEFDRPAIITGQTPQTKRQAIVDRFQDEEDCRLFIGNIMAAGMGIKLSASSLVVFAELDWVPGNMSQAEDRCFDLTKRDPVWVQHLVLADSIDYKIANSLISKQAVIDAALDGKGDLAEEDVLPKEVLDSIFNI